MGIWLVGAAIVISTVLITQKMSNGKEKDDMFVSIFVGMWVVVLLVLWLVK